MTDKPAATGQLGTVGTALDVLSLLRARPMTISEILTETGLERSSAYRVLRTLAGRGFVDRSASGTYRLGIALWELGVAARRQLPLREMTSKAIHDLAQNLGETVVMTIYDEGYAVYVDMAEGTEPVRSYVQLGIRAPAYCVASGKALLAYQPEHEVDRLIDAGFEHFTDETVSSGPELVDTLAEIRRTGVAVNRGEWRAEVGGYAVPVRDFEGTAVFAFGFSGPINRLERRSEELIAALREAQRALTAELRSSRSA